MKEDEFPDWSVEETIKVLESGGISKVLVNGQPYMTWDTGDEASRRMAIVQLYVSGLGRQENLARIFGVHVNSVQKHIADFTERGFLGLISQTSGPKTNWKVTPRVRAKIMMIIFEEKISGLKAIQKRLKDGWHADVSLSSIRQVLMENGMSEEKPNAVDNELLPDDLFYGARENQLGFNFGSARKIDCTVVSAWARGKDYNADEGEDDEGGLAFKTRARDEYSRRQRVYLDVLEQGDYPVGSGRIMRMPGDCFLRRC